MTFAYYARLTRAQQAIYRKSDAVTELALPHAGALRVLVGDLELALRSEDRAATQAATARLVEGLTRVLEVPPVLVQVLAARPHARWGELHGLYTADRGRPPKIQLWMRTAKQKRVVAFRTYLRTVLHEVCHHVDYSGLRLRDSFHTEGFYKRESSLFHQLLPERTLTMRTMEEYATLPRAERLARLARTPDELAEAIRGQSETALAHRPDPKNWAAKEVVCHLRDVEESFFGRLETIMLMDAPKFLPVTPDRWAEERQYLRNDAGDALGAFRRRRDEMLAFMKKLAAGDWGRGGIHATRGLMTIDDFLTLIAWHDDNHLDQLRRALEGKS